MPQHHRLRVWVSMSKMGLAQPHTTRLARHFGIGFLHKRRASVRNQVMKLFFRVYPPRHQSPQVRQTDVGDVAMGRFGNARKQVDFSLIVGAHFDHDKVRLGWSIQQGERHPDVVVQIAFCGMHIHPLSQHIANQLFGRGFAVASSHPQHGAIPTSPVGPGEALQGFQFLGNHGDFGMASPLRICGDGMGRSLIEGALNKCIAVKVCATKRACIQVLRVRGKSFGGVSGFKQAVDGVSAR